MEGFKIDDSSQFRTFVKQSRDQLELSGVPNIFWEALWEKLRHETFDGGHVFQLARMDYGDEERGPKDPVWKVFVAAENGLSMHDPNNIFLIDHAWKYDSSTARRNLSETPGLLERMCNLMGFDNARPEDEKVEFVLSEMWRYNQAFTLNQGLIEDRMPVWYIMDELGAAINHSDDPNFRAVPFLDVCGGVTYTLLFPVKNVENGEEVTRDFVEGQTNDADKRRALVLPWRDDDFSNENFTQVEPEEDYFLSGKISETLPGDIDDRTLWPSGKLKVFSEYIYIHKYLTDPAFELVEEIFRADILWLLDHFKDYHEFSAQQPHAFVNQFPFENVLTTKDLLAIVCRRKAGDQKYDPETLETYPSWLPTTYNLSTELVKFVAYFQQRESRSLDNHWICKPWNLARGLDTHVTKNLDHILRLPSTGPKIAQKYIDTPVLYTRPGVGKVKFDIRYVVLLKSVEPLVAYAYTNFFLRFANKEFALNNLDVYEQHFTVMNYEDSSRLYHVKCADFIVEWNNMYKDCDWKSKVEPRIFEMLKEVLEAAASEKPPRGIAKSPQSRAVYAVDLMLQWKDNEMQPVVLEVNFCPDNKRACEYYPEFYNDIFRCLFLDVTNPDVFHELCTDT